MPRIYRTRKWKPLLQCLKDNDPEITLLDLENNHLDDAGVKKLCLALQTNNKVTCLKLGYNRIPKECAEYIALLLETNQTLTLLDLRFNDLENAGVQKISHALSANIKLLSLSLCGNFIEDDGAKSIGQALLSNRTLVSLDLSGNHITDTGAKFISAALQTNQKLASLDLGFNFIDEQGVKAISVALQANEALTSLSVSGITINDASAQHLINACKINNTLKTLVIRHTGMSDELQTQLEQTIAYNQQQIIVRRNQFIRTLMVLTYAHANANSQSPLMQLPKDVLLYMINWMDFRSQESIGKSAQQIKACAKFIMNHEKELDAALQEAIQTGKDLQVKENITTGQFRFFLSKPKPTKRPLVSEEPLERPSKIQKTP